MVDVGKGFIHVKLGALKRILEKSLCVGVPPG